MNKTLIFADGNCVVCDVEVSHYKRLAPQLFDIVDISNENFDAAKYNLSTKDVNENLHVLTPEGEMKIGVDAFAHIWSRLDRYKWASNLIKTPPIHYAAKLAYKGFTIVRPYLPKKS